MQSLIRKALAPCSTVGFLRAKHGVFPQNKRREVIRYASYEGPVCGVSGSSHKGRKPDLRCIICRGLLCGTKLKCAQCSIGYNGPRTAVRSEARLGSMCPQATLWKPGYPVNGLRALQSNLTHERPQSSRAVGKGDRFECVARFPTTPATFA